MTYFNRSAGGSRGNQFYGSRSGFDRSERKELFDAVCAKCGGVAKVPFRPNGRKDVFCSQCFSEMNGEEPRVGNRFESRSNDRGFGDRNRFDKPMFNAICDECGDNCQVPFEPRNGKPVLCSECFAKKDDRGSDSKSFSSTPRAASNSVDLSEINAKLDKIIKMLSSETPKKEITEKILETIEMTSGKEVVPAKKKAKKVAKKVVKE